MPGPKPAPFGLLPPASYGGEVHAEQKLTLSRGGLTQTLQAFVDVTPARISVVGLTALGARALTLDYDGQSVSPPSKDAVEQFRNEQVLRDLELMTWPLSALQQAAAGSEFRIDQPRASLRQIWRGDVLVAEVRCLQGCGFDGHSWLVNFDARYSIEIESKVIH